MRLVQPIVTNSGFGSNVIALAKAQRIAEVCDMAFQPPLWPFCGYTKPRTRDGYGYYFQCTEREQWRQEVLNQHRQLWKRYGFGLIPNAHFGYEEYLQMGQQDVGEAALQFLERYSSTNPSQPLYLTVDGAWGRYKAIPSMRPWLNTFIRTHEPSIQRVTRIQSYIPTNRVRVGVHIRMGNFSRRHPEYDVRAGERITRLPMDWYMQVCDLIRQTCDPVFILTSDGTESELKPFLDRFNPIHTLGQQYHDLVDLMLLSEADLLVCSNSSYSRLAAFLSDRPFIWCADTLYSDDTGHNGYLWREDRDKPVRKTSFHDFSAIQRSYAISQDVSRLPPGLQRYLQLGATLPVETGPNLLYGEPVAFWRAYQEVQA